MSENTDNFLKAFNEAYSHYETITIEERDEEFFKYTTKISQEPALWDLIEPFIFLSIAIYQSMDSAATKFKEAFPHSIRLQQFERLDKTRQNNSSFRAFLLEA